MRLELQIAGRQTLPGWLVWQGGMPATPDDFTAWIAAHRDDLESALAHNGAVVIRGLRLASALEFRQVCATVNPLLQNYGGGDSPRTGLADQVYTSTEYDASLEVLLHNELSYAAQS